MNDCISRQEAIKIIEHRRKQNPMASVEFIRGMQDAYLRILSDIRALPPVEYNDSVDTRGNNND